MEGHRHQLRAAEVLHQDPLPLVKLRQGFLVLEVAVGTGLTTPTMAGREVDARATAQVWMAPAAQAGCNQGWQAHFGLLNRFLTDFGLAKLGGALREAAHVAAHRLLCFLILL